MAKSALARASRQVISQVVVARASASTSAGSSAWAWRYLRRISRRLAACQGSRSASSLGRGQLLAGLGVGQQLVREPLEGRRSARRARRRALPASSRPCPSSGSPSAPSTPAIRRKRLLKRRVVPAHGLSPSAALGRAGAQRHSSRVMHGEGQHAHRLVQHGLPDGASSRMTRAPRPIWSDDQPARDGRAAGAGRDVRRARQRAQDQQARPVAAASTRWAKWIRIQVAEVRDQRAVAERPGRAGERGAALGRHRGAHHGEQRQHQASTARRR